MRILYLGSCLVLIFKREEGVFDGFVFLKQVKVAKKIAKDMERWAKAQNKRNESSTKNPNPEPAGGSVGEGPIGSGAADAAFAVLLERRERPPLDKHTFQMHMKKDVPPVRVC